MGVLLTVVSIVIVVAGLLSLSNATLGVGLLSFACWIGIMARLAQSAAQHGDILKHMNTAAAAPAAGLSQRVLREPGEGEIRCQKCGHVAPRGPSACPLCFAPYA